MDLSPVSFQMEKTGTREGAGKDKYKFVSCLRKQNYDPIGHKRPEAWGLKV